MFPTATILAVPWTLPAGDCQDSSSPGLKVLLIADVRSPTTWGWVDAIRRSGVTVLGVDGRPWPERELEVKGSSAIRAGVRRRIAAATAATPRRIQIVQRLRLIAGPSLATISGRRLRTVVTRVKPDVVHGLRIPNEGMKALAACPHNVPLAVSIWGSDLIYHAPLSYMTGRATRRVLARTNLLFSDCQRDVDLAFHWGLRPETPSVVLPGGGGIDLDRYSDDADAHHAIVASLVDDLEAGHRLVVNPRGCRESMRNDVLLEALSLLASDIDPSVRILFVDAKSNLVIRRAIDRHPLAERIMVIGKITPGEMRSVLCRAEVSVSIASRDGTPNSLLEAMSAGAIPVCGDISSIREWIEPGRNGFLAPCDDPKAVANALQAALRLSEPERRLMRLESRQIIARRADRKTVGMLAAEKYQLLSGVVRGSAAAAGR